MMHLVSTHKSQSKQRIRPKEWFQEKDDSNNNPHDQIPEFQEVRCRIGKKINQTQVDILKNQNKYREKLT